MRGVFNNKTVKACDWLSQMILFVYIYMNHLQSEYDGHTMGQILTAVFHIKTVVACRLKRVILILLI